MPKINAGRPRGPEADAAIRVALERERRGWSAAELARRMTTAGCPINQSAVNKIEQGDPPRRITVDELVAFAKVYELEVEDLLLPAHAARDKQIADSYRQISKVGGYAVTCVEVVLKELTQLSELIAMDERNVAWASEACTDAQYFLGNLGAAVENLDEGMRERLRSDEPNKPSVAELNFRSLPYHRRAAVAASPKAASTPPPSESSEAARKKRW